MSSTSVCRRSFAMSITAFTLTQFHIFIVFKCDSNEYFSLQWFGGVRRSFVQFQNLWLDVDEIFVRKVNAGFFVFVVWQSVATQRFQSSKTDEIPFIFKSNIRPLPVAHIRQLICGSLYYSPRILSGSNLLLYEEKPCTWQHCSSTSFELY